MPIIIPGNRLASTGFAIDQSIRFNDDDSPYMYRSFSGAGDLKTATMSCWLKMGNISTNKGIFTFISDKSCNDLWETILWY